MPNASDLERARRKRLCLLLQRPRLATKVHLQTFYLLRCACSMRQYCGAPNQLHQGVSFLFYSEHSAHEYPPWLHTQEKLSHNGLPLAPQKLMWVGLPAVPVGDTGTIKANEAMDSAGQDWFHKTWNTDDYFVHSADCPDHSADSFLLILYNQPSVFLTQTTLLLLKICLHWILCSPAHLCLFVLEK